MAREVPDQRVPAPIGEILNCPADLVEPATAPYRTYSGPQRTLAVAAQLRRALIDRWNGNAGTRVGKIAVDLGRDVNVDPTTWLHDLIAGNAMGNRW